MVVLGLASDAAISPASARTFSLIDLPFEERFRLLGPHGGGSGHAKRDSRFCASAQVLVEGKQHRDPQNGKVHSLAPGMLCVGHAVLGAVGEWRIQ